MSGEWPTYKWAEFFKARNIAMFADGEGYLVELGNDLFLVTPDERCRLVSCQCGGNCPVGLEKRKPNWKPS